ncbi:Glycosyltransferase, catalytic subunit of cellulose synthase and poly-beta-1,6-N-acetylglucosamine synthase [Paenibacillus sp. 1_12]|uniref:glycosyltransferase n=1 Tax=Paenibacillus sp. 1_12 TaxID=1566278 RepID=UPI0008F38341|nr:glycosyltransferase family 2 protein [Paenibacillus sp. 1_12]SFL66835.1 Glycosyltransferase, catalytic subunit of cellulose synthase and poly-beta-1,6-N-acetylglucosamine synthase [Paenibacillus sp. 1_12]
MFIFKLLAILTLIYWVVMLGDTLWARKLMRQLPASSKPGGSASTEAIVPSGLAQPRGTTAKELPLVSVIIAAKEEEASITETVKHLLNQTYPRFEIIAVNDRSQDSTGHKLEELRRWSQGKREVEVPLTIIHVTTLPAGWLGKNHALYQGFLQARGQIILFTDADVLFQPHALADSVHYMKETEADHLTLTPKIVVNSFWLSAFVQYFFFTFSLYIRPWRANIDSQHKHGMGVGAFNMITRQAYDRIGTHQAFAFRPDDDLQLGMRVKQAGLRQRLASGRTQLAVEWYTSLREAVQGLEKNIFSGFQYRVLPAAAGVIGQLLMFFFPFVAIFVLHGWVFWSYVLSIVLMLTVYGLLIQSLIGKIGKELLVFPVTVCLLSYIVTRSVWLTLRQGGIHWRGTFYVLEQLKKMKR